MDATPKSDDKKSDDTAKQDSTTEGTAKAATDGGKGTPAKDTPPKGRDNAVRTRKATEDERKPGAKIKVGDATEIKEDPAEKDSDKKDGDKKDATSAAEKLTGNDAKLRVGRTKAERYADAAAKNPANAPKPGATKAPGKKAERDAKYPFVAKAVKDAKAISGEKKSLKPGEHIPAAGPKEHIWVRTRVTQLLTDGNEEAVAKVMLNQPVEQVTADAVLKLTGIKTQKKLREIATWDADRSEMEPMRKLSSEFKGDGWAQGRYLAAILYTWITDLKAQAKEIAKAKKTGAKKDGQAKTTA